MNSKKDEELTEALELIFDERQKFIIIGLTGRTGSGCTTAAKLLAKKFQDFSPPKPTHSSPHTDEERKYKTVYNHLLNNWGKFFHIQLRDIITSFILESKFTQLIELYSLILRESPESIANKIPGDYKREFDAIREIRLKSKSDVENSEENLSKDEVYDLYFEKIPRFTELTKTTLNKIQQGSFTRLYQAAANNIRRSGEPYSEQFNPKHIFRLSQRTNKLIKGS